MPWLGTITVVGVAILIVLVWLFVRARGQDVMTELMEKRKASSKLVARAEYVEGLESIPVAIALTDDSFYYENADLQASFELGRIDEVEYDDELATGRQVEQGCRVLRMRSHGAAFEFILSSQDAPRWASALPPRRMDQGTAQAV